ncbi:uncharacterized protein PHALS_10148 [Plasmopara halstedii]|uniref:Uncharacterized protein n=1 Tax=Plasmopara halstedii TaxID=4781 RepID=A0A0P1AGF8_PLAHL|nr:uncharacterized protein PHALS_10148 [Plasmopara halstedii]CEG39922.1 hypothetical protein PHALS_10148 [Plasmopara halstedii]|eukprot:XP_024576291.1 hypothetical protein PHALS_10148 [Plasmopara halstedii]
MRKEHVKELFLVVDDPLRSINASIVEGGEVHTAEGRAKESPGFDSSPMPFVKAL